MIRFAEAADTPAVRTLFDLCFPDESGFNAYYFEHIYRPGQTLLYVWEGELCAMLQMLPYRLSMNGTVGEATYIYGACTHPAHRRKHLMAQLLEASFQDDLRHGRIASFLIPQEEWLFDFYHPFGYEPIFQYEKRIILQKPGIFSEIQMLKDCCEAEHLYSKKALKSSCCLLRSETDWQAQIALFQALGAGTFGLYEEGRLAAYAFVWKETDGLFAQELLAEDERCAELLSQALLHCLGAQKLVYHTVGTGHVLACLKPYQNNVSTQGYLNLMFN